MGGGAFFHASSPGQPTLNTPRMSTETYAHLRHVYKERLLAYFPQVQLDTLIEAPDKHDHGDIDFVLANDGQIDFFDLASHLGARGLICHSSHKCTLGVPIDGSRHNGTVALYKHVHDHVKPGNKLSEAASSTERPDSRDGNQEEKPERSSSHPLEPELSCNHPLDTINHHTKGVYAQIDFDVVPIYLYPWHIFYASYGDMASLLGHIVHRLGFTVSNKGLWLRMVELDTSKSVPYQNIPDKEGMLQLSHDPVEVMEFLGLDVEHYRHGFRTLEELYAWLGKCRMLHAEAIECKRNNAHGRNRKAKRPVYSRFFNEWLPNLPARPNPGIIDHISPPENEQSPSFVAPSCGCLSPELIRLRSDYAREAAVFFHRQSEYETMHKNLVHKVDSATSAQLLKPLIAAYSGKTDKKLNDIVRAFRRFVGVESINDEVRIHILQNPHTDDESELWQLLVEQDGEKILRDQTNISIFVAESWQQLRELERRAKSAR